MTNTMNCDLLSSLVGRFKENRSFWEKSNSGLPDINGNIIPWSELFGAEDGCALNRMRGHSETYCTCPAFNQIVQIIDKDTKKPLPNIWYTLKSTSGQYIDGKTDENGYTDKINTHEEEEIELTIFS